MDFSHPPKREVLCADLRVWLDANRDEFARLVVGGVT